MEWTLLKAIERYLACTEGASWSGSVFRKWDKRFHRAIDTIEYLFGPDRSLRLGAVGCIVLAAAVGAQETEILVRFLREEMPRSGPRVAWKLMKRFHMELLARSR